MPKFSYKAFNATGDMTVGEIDAPSKETCEDKLFLSGLTPIELKEITSLNSKFNFKLDLIPSKPSSAQIANFTREFATLQEANVPLDQSLRILS